jgi:mono/diheme cytochrome c family protein
MTRSRCARARLITGLIVLAAASPATAAEPVPRQQLYGRYCASCHGLQGRGDGPAAGALSPPPTDLTKLESGVPELMKWIDGRRTVRAHGSGSMPVWGEVFEQSLIEGPHARRSALLKVEAIAEYVQDLRKRAR